MQVVLLKPRQCQRYLQRLNELSDLPWQVEDDYLCKTFQFHHFDEAFEFMVQVTHLIKRHNHHPFWSNEFAKVEIQLSTRDVGGLSMRDFSLASDIERLALHHRSKSPLLNDGDESQIFV